MAEGTKVGAVYFDVDLNNKDIGSKVKQTGGQIQNLFSKAFSKGGKSISDGLGSAMSGALSSIGPMVAGAFAVEKLVEFGSQCVSVASDLIEVQNVVDVTFGAMSGAIDSFARDAADKFGLTEKAAKEYSGYMGSMLKSMGMTTGQSAKMSTELAGLAGDMASFYNLDTGTAFEKIRSGISGETEPLKQLGINMSVANMEAYRLAQGIKTSYSEMNQAQQALLRYNYLLETTSDAQGDFARNSGTWANTMARLNLEWNKFKTLIGQLLIPLLKPLFQGLVQILKVVNGLIESLLKLFGIVSDGGLSIELPEVDTSAAAIDSLAGAYGDAGDAAEEAGKKAKKAHGFLFGFDELNNLPWPEEEEETGGDDSSGIFDGELPMTMKKIETPKLDFKWPEFKWPAFPPFIWPPFPPLPEFSFAEAFEAVQEFVKSLSNVFENAFSKVPSSIQVNAPSYIPVQAPSNIPVLAPAGIPLLVPPLPPIQVQRPAWVVRFESNLNAFGSWISGAIPPASAQSPVSALGVEALVIAAATAAANVGAFAESIRLALGKIPSFGEVFSSLQAKISRMLPSMDTFNAAFNKIPDIWNSLTTTLQTAFEAVSPVRLGEKIRLWFEGLDFSWLTEAWNRITEGIKTALDIISPVKLGEKIRDWFIGLDFSGITSAVEGIDLESIFPWLLGGAGAVGAVAIGEKVLETSLQGATNVAGVVDLNRPMEEFKRSMYGEAYEESEARKKAYGEFLDYGIDWSDLGGTLTRWWNNIKDQWDYDSKQDTALVNSWGQSNSVDGRLNISVDPKWEEFKAKVSETFETIKASIQNGWETAKATVSETFETIKASIQNGWETAKAKVSETFETIRTAISGKWGTIKTNLSKTFDSLRESISSKWDEIKANVSKAFDTLRTSISDKWETIKTNISTVFNTLRTSISDKWETIKANISTVFNTLRTSISDKWDTIKANISTVFNSIRTSMSDKWGPVMSIVATAFSSMRSYISDKWFTIRSNISVAFDSMRSSMSTGWSYIRDGISNVFDRIRSSISGGWDWVEYGVSRAIDGITSAVKRLFSVDTSSASSGSTSGGGGGSIPRMAAGGYVTKPTLTLIGEAGKEAVIPLENNTGWMSSLANLLADAVMTRLQMAQGDSNSGNQNLQNIQLVLNERTLGEAILDPLLQAANRRGITLNVPVRGY
ncbi:MAG: hypothetical protein LBB94_05390 [Clostridiales bacterium]|nr:hypothetical protein [Clostridiales bacterium]